MRSIALLSIILLFIPYISAEPHDFSVQKIDESVVNISDYGSKPILLEWAASWCGNCKANIEKMYEIYPQYSDKVNFLTVSFGGSGDDLDDVASLKTKGDITYPWDFSLDHTNYASEVGARNSHTWILTPDLELFENWGYGLRTTSDLVTGLDNVLAQISVTTEVSSSTSTHQSTVNETTGENITSSTIFSSSQEQSVSSISSTISTSNPLNEIETYGVLENELFIGFVGVSILATIGVVLQKRFF